MTISPRLHVGVACFVVVALGGCTAQEATPSERVEIQPIVDSLNNYWAQHDAELGFTYAPVPAERIGTGGSALTCNNKRIDEEDVADNAFVDSTCDEGITIAYDPAYVGASLVTAEATLAHEWGHVIQAQSDEIDLSADPDGYPIDAELQADCFAGAWAADQAESDISALRTDTEKSGDVDDVNIEDPDAHGTPQQRGRAFDIGLGGGPQACIGQLVEVLPE